MIVLTTHACMHACMHACIHAPNTASVQCVVQPGLQGVTVATKGGDGATRVVTITEAI
jgi:hypothetical protein